MSWTRRDFLRNCATGAVGTALTPYLSACAQLDRAIVGDGANEVHSVLILGAGLSGLVAGRELKKMGVPFRIFEGSHRIGGRAYTLEDFNSASQSAELGGEWISEDDEFVLNLCRELKIQVDTLSSESRWPALFTEGKWSDAKTLLKSLHALDYQILEKKYKQNDLFWDDHSVEEFLADLKFTSETEKLWIRRAVQLEWGADPGDISALAYLDRFGASPSGLKKILGRRIKIQGGTQTLARAVYDKIAGVVPERFILFGHRLRAIRAKVSALELDFETEKGNFTIEARVVICTIPFSVLRNIRGIDYMDFSAEKIRAIKELSYGTHGKMVASFSEKFWHNKTEMWMGDFPSQWYWDSSLAPDLPAMSPHVVLSAQIAGPGGKEIGLHSLQAWKADLKNMEGNGKEVHEENFQVMNWSKNPWSQGSVSCFRPKQVQLIASALPNSERRGTFIFAGEHTSLNSGGSMNGAIESGVRAALEASRFKAELAAPKI